MKRIIIVAVASLALLSACASTPEKITAAPAGPSLPVPITNPTIVTDLQSAAYNLDNAVAVGALSKDDPAPACLHSVLQQADIETPAGAAPAASFTPKNDGVASLGAIAYIQIQQAKAAAGQGISVALPCKALLGQFVIDGAVGLAKVAPISPALRLLPALR